MPYLKEIKQKLSGEIRLKRLHLRLSQQQLSQMAGVSVVTLSKLENRDTSVKDTAYDACSKALNDYQDNR